jgi:hypothetical protein
MNYPRTVCAHCGRNVAREPYSMRYCRHGSPTACPASWLTESAARNLSESDHTPRSRRLAATKLAVTLTHHYRIYRQSGDSVELLPAYIALAAAGGDIKDFVIHELCEALAVFVPARDLAK